MSKQGSQRTENRFPGKAVNNQVQNRGDQKNFSHRLLQKMQKCFFVRFFYLHDNLRVKAGAHLAGTFSPQRLEKPGCKRAPVSCPMLYTISDNITSVNKLFGHCVRFSAVFLLAPAVF